MKKSLFVLLLFLWVQGVTYAQEKNNEEYILILNSINFEEIWTKDYYESLRGKLLKDNYRVEVEELSVPMVKNETEAYERLQHLQDKYKNPPKAIVCIGDPGWLFCRSLFDTIWKDVPSIICYSRDTLPNKLGNLLTLNMDSPDTVITAKEIYGKYNVTVLKCPFYIKETISLMQKLIPDITRLAFIGDNRFISVMARKELEEVVKKDFPNLEVDILTSPELTTEKLLNKLSTYNRTTGVIYYSWFVTRKDEEGEYLVDNIKKIISGFLDFPVFSLSDTNVESGQFVGGHYIRTEDCAQATINVLRLVLSGTSSHDIPFQTGGKPVTCLNYRLLQYYGIDSSLYPNDAIYYHEPPGFIDRYRNYIIVAAIVLVLLASVIILRSRMKKQRLSMLEREYKLVSRYRQMVNNMPVIYIRKRLIMDNDGNVIDFIILDVNPTFEHTFHCINRDIKDRKWSEVQKEYTDLKLIPQLMIGKMGLIELKDDNGEQRYYDKLVFSEKNERDVVDVFCIDKTEAHSNWVKMKDLNRKYELVLHATNMIPCSWNLQKKEFVYRLLNDNAECLDEQAISQDQFFVRILQEDVRRVYASYKDVVEGRSELFHEEFRVNDIQKGIIWVECFAIISKKTKEGCPLILVGGLINISNRKQMEEDILEKEKVETASRLKSAFLANMSHEIRTPLNAIVGFSNLLAEVDDPEERKEYVSIIQHNNQLLLRLINDILDISRMETGRFDFVYAPVNINTLLVEIEQSTRLRASSKNITVSFAEHLPESVIMMDQNRFTQVMTNLLHNAIKFTDRGSIEFGYRKVDKELYFYVKDTGCGIPEDQLDTIFGRFVKVNSFEQGFGLGLAICEKIVEGLGGHIGVKSELGKGSVFWFTLPYKLSVEQKGEAYGADLSENGVDEEKYMLLIAEDNIYNYKLLEAILKREYNLIHAWNGREAVSLFMEQHPKLVLLDIKMPEMDGYEALAAIRELSPSIPAIAITAHAFSENEQKIKESGFDGYIAKPINPSQLKEIIYSYVRKF